MQTPDRDELIAKVPPLTREQFELRLVNIETCYALAFENAKAMDYLSATARDHARQRRINMMVESMICALEDESNVALHVWREEKYSHIPFPPKVNHEQTMIAFDKRGR